MIRSPTDSAGIIAGALQLLQDGILHIDQELELLKVSCRQAGMKDGGGWLVTFRVHVDDRNHPLVEAPTGTICIVKSMAMELYDRLDPEKVGE